MFSKIVLSIAFATLCLGAPTPDAPVRGYSAPRNQYAAPQVQYSQPQQIYQQPQQSYQKPRVQYDEPKQYVEPPKYEFSYAVNDAYSGNDFGHDETRDGYRTDGSYYVLLPDGRRQTVKYYVDGDSGFVADVSYEGEASYETPRQSYQQPQPSYQQPQQIYQQPQSAYQQPSRSQYGF